ncbi:DedA family protein [Amycolatopsis echigonensis]|uniref:DedA family protein n=1 Tax=Amycolatopsis echigonensis TaxID=2576905 RepID=A0A2N3WHT2_9PSEU|nr:MULTISPECIES: DedA family protein [Amycolatopsis]MBB2504540.1 DedA family protein [Amycolatopsis echigonensis]PKV93422.1 membrane protein DedA with SNARE-associated domain [Amycolatopsis niigatensis]
MNIDHVLEAIPPLSVYLLVGLVVMVESLGIPLPGEIVLVSAALLASSHSGLNPVWIGVLASAGAIVGDSIGYLIGRKGGKRLFAWAGRKFPKHFGPDHVASAERMFHKRGMWAVFFGRFVAVLRILAGPLAGSLNMHYPRFLIANALGGIIWAGGTTALIYYLGVVADKWLKGFQWAGLGAALVIGVVVTLVLKKRMARNATSSSQSEEKNDAVA